MAAYDIPPKIVYELGGGINRGLPPTEIEQNESVVIENFYAFGKKLIRRGGTRRITTSPYTEPLVSFVPYSEDVGGTAVWRIIVRAYQSYGRYLYTSASNIRVVAIPRDPTLSLGTASLPGAMFAYNGVVYSCPPYGGSIGLFRITDVVQRAGIIAPTVAPNMADAAAAGVLADGNYQSVYTYFNATTGVESNPSPASAVLTLAGGGSKIDHSAIADPPAGINQITHKRVYRTLINQVGEYYYVGTVALGATTLTEELLPLQMGDPVLFDNNVPPAYLAWAAVWNDRCFGTDGNNLLFTNLFTMEGWTNDVIPVLQDEGHRIVVVFAWEDRLIIGKTNKILYLTGTDRSTFRLRTLSDKFGCTAPNSMKTAEGLLFWFGTGRNFYRSDGVNTAPIGDVKIRPLIDAIPIGMESLVSASINVPLSQYIVSIPDVTSGTNDEYFGPAKNHITLVYNYRTDVWTVYRYKGGCDSTYGAYPDVERAYGFIGEVFSATPLPGGYALWATMYDGHLYRVSDPSRGYDDGYIVSAGGEGMGFGTEASIPITAKILTREEDGGSLMAKALRRIHLLCTTAAEVVTLKAYRDGRAVPSVSRDVSLNVDSAWKVANLATLRDPGSTVQLGVEYTGTTAIEVEAIGLEVESVERFSGQPQ